MTLKSWGFSLSTEKINNLAHHLPFVWNNLRSRLRKDIKERGKRKFETNSSHISSWKTLIINNSSTYPLPPPLNLQNEFSEWMTINNFIYYLNEGDCPPCFSFSWYKNCVVYNKILISEQQIPELTRSIRRNRLCCPQ